MVAQSFQPQRSKGVERPHITSVSFQPLTDYKGLVKAVRPAVSVLLRIFTVLTQLSRRSHALHPII